ncbi:mitochondrial inner membrane protein required for protein import, partial [Lunasporangiospora selenospora]
GPYPGEDGQKDRENHPDEGFLDGFIRRSRERCGAIQSAATSPILDKLLPDPTQGPNQPRLTLVINLDYTLIHSAWTKEHGWRIAKRPGVDQFLSKLSQHYELVIFTTQTSSNAERILEKLDPQHQVRYLLDRDSTRLVNGKYVKDLSYLNRDLSNVIIMDSNPESHSLQPENAIAMEPWEGDPNDTRLMAMIPILEAMATSDESDVRVLLAKYQGRITSQA